MLLWRLSPARPPAAAGRGSLPDPRRSGQRPGRCSKSVGAWESVLREGWTKAAGSLRFLRFCGASAALGEAPWFDLGQGSLFFNQT